ncbi:PREDICTED: NUCLEAR FUSION DEFECTIVE [Prunus dulcis]|uniref:PREDICTED: NUCLEAR FUSION DEFECTIVE n=1 Tax=Prunus dulcis TaxID=3755 RepID=A0A5E4EMV0_PRUDU|nr:PREDICTED: NUCLEAR FUSION DEFECTIVE [Prunus dulcis]
MEGSQQRNGLRLRLFDSKWVSTVASIWIQCTSGSLYIFSIYSQNLKATQGYDQSTLDTVSVFKDFGANCGGPLWPPLLLLRHVACALVGPLGRGGPVLRGLLPHVDRRRRRYSPGAGARDVPFHVRGGSCYVFL